MSSVVIVDSACDLPERVVNSKSVQVLPLNLLLGDKQVSDIYDADERLQMIKDGTLDIKNDVNTAPATREQIIDFLVSKILPNYDFAIVQTVTRARSPQYEMWQEVNTTFAASYRRYRNTDKNFTLRIMNSGAMFSGQGLMALNTLHLGQQGVSRRELLEKSKSMADYIQSYAAPMDLHYLRERARRKGDRSIGFLSAHLGKALNICPIIYGGQDATENMGTVKGHENAVNQLAMHAMRCIEKGLRTPLISIAYAGPLEDLERYSALQDLKGMAKEYGVRIATSVHMVTPIINLGPGAFSLAVAPSDPDFKLRIG